MKHSVLDITKLPDNRYVFSLSEPGELFTGPVRGAWQVAVRATAVGHLCRMIADSADRAQGSPDTPGIALSPFVTAGRGLYDTVFPPHDRDLDDLRRSLRELQTPLLISTNDPDVFWELLHDGDEFLGLRCELGRQLKTHHLPRGAVRESDGLRCLMIANPNDNEPDWSLPDTAEEARGLCEWLRSRSVERVDYLEGADAGFGAVLERLLDTPYDLIHYAGHVVEDRSTGEWGLRLHDGELFTPRDVRNYVKGSPFVFVNGCWSGKAVEGLTGGFLEAGAQVVVGSLFRVPDEGARAFAEKFYDLLLSGATVGAAMRAARLHVMSVERYAATWASYVLYGSPCIAMEIKEDPLQEALRPLGLGRPQLESSCAEVLEQAVEYVRPGARLGTPHLFAAMIGGADSLLRDRLGEQGVAAEDLRRAFQEAFGTKPEPGTDTPRAAPLALSDSAKAILLRAQALAGESGADRISERHLVTAFAREGAGSTGQILEKLNVRVEALDPDRAECGMRNAECGLEEPQEPRTGQPSGEREEGFPHPQSAFRIPQPEGPQSAFGNPQSDDPQSAIRNPQSEYSPLARRALARAEALAWESGSRLVGTPHLVLGMLSLERGALVEALARLGIDPGDLAGGRTSAAAGAESTSRMAWSPNAAQLLQLARTIAQVNRRAQVTDRDLLEALVQQGGGKAGELLRASGIVLQSLTSALFLPDGLPDPERFDTGALRLLEAGAEYARRRGYDRLGRRHLLYAALTGEGYLAGFIRDQGRDPGALAELLHSVLPPGPSPIGRAEATAARCSGDLVRLLCAAEEDARTGRDGRLTESLLVRSLLNAGGVGVRLLVEQGVRLGSLL